MKRALLTLLLAASLGAAGTVAAPALSTRPYVPAPVDFKLAPGERAAGQEVGGRVVSRPLAAPKRFDIVGLRWRGGDDRAKVELRVRRKGDRWSGWADATVDPDHAPDPGRGEPDPTGVSAPVWADGANEVQYRTSDRLRGVELKFINTTGTATAADRAETAVRTAANRGVTGVAGLFTATAVSQPTMITRSQWGADDHCRPRQPSERGVVKAVFVHHTVNANSYSRSDARSMVLGICRYHRDTNGWDDIGYNFLVDKYGQIFEGRNGGVRRANIGAQAQGWNDQSTGVANLGTFESSGQSSAGLRAMDRLITWKLSVHGTPLGGRVTLTSRGGSLNRYPEGQRVTFNRISGHRDGDNTSCPGSALYAQLQRLRRAVEEGEDTRPPAAPQNLTERSGPGRVALNWFDNRESDLAGYRIYRRTIDTSYRSIATTRSSAYTDTSVRGGTAYYYRVKAYDGSGNLSSYSNFVKGLPTVPHEQVLDNRSAAFSASSAWSTSSAARARYGADYRYAAPREGVGDPARFQLRAVPRPGRYELLFWHPAHSAYSQSAPVGVETPAGTTFNRFDLRTNGGRWLSLGTYSLAAGEAPSVLVSRWTTAPGWLIADAARIVER
ncbi:MAG TPA: N-acetylmuramoyl-L-alanine amidase [Thermoleophilaceae bacterium]|nr:N-acetylmuramoyl-L-alanine amidase [Thermoleophilaceae bacterium]